VSELVEAFQPIDADEPLERIAARALGRSQARVGAVRVMRRSLDARRGRPLGHRLRLLVLEPGEVDDAAADEARQSRRAIAPWPAGRPTPQVVIVGAGPAGTWASLRLVELGVSTVTIAERGKPVQPRRHDLASLQRGRLDPDSNYCFGEGGAGTYSDGKLYTRSKDRAGVAQVIADLVRFGAPDDVAVDSRPHVGSNRLPKVLTALRAELEANGVRYAWGSEVVGLRVDRGRVRAARLRGGGELGADAVVLAVGHSARSVYAWLAEGGFAIERKGSAFGVRIEHPQPLIDEIQYGAAAGHPKLPAAFYELKTQARGRGVYSFCMCPGGFIVPAATEPDGVVVNGMSLSRRDSPFANSGLVVTMAPGDYGPDAAGPLAGVELQRSIERAAFVAGGGAFRAPAQRLADFLAGRASGALPKTSYHPGVTPCDLRAVLPEPIASALRDGLEQLARAVPRYGHADAVLVATETRSSAPVRLARDPETLASPGVEGLYPAGEGAGYAGGIVSAALDGVRIADAIAARWSR
jgi:uncharacterized FAD-dependent dehydrogenase